MYRTFITLAIGAIGMFAPVAADAQSLFDEIIIDGETVSVDTVAPAKEKSARELRRESAAAERARRARRAAMKRAGIDNPLWEMTDAEGNLLEPEIFGPQTLNPDTVEVIEELLLPEQVRFPMIFSRYNTDIARPDGFAEAARLLDADNMNWADMAVMRDRRRQMLEQDFMIARPDLVPYNLDHMPRPPKEFVMEVDPTQAKITVSEFVRDQKEMEHVVEPLHLKPIHWLKNFDASLQFSQAYVSPNWYQGGNSNLNAILNVLYDVKLNPAFHPNLIFETSVQYKLGINNAPDDTVHSYNISEDLLQVNSKIGLKAAKRWYYSMNVQFKTQLLNNYRTNSNDLAAAFLSPGELNLGLGMTYNYENPKKTRVFRRPLAAVVQPEDVHQLAPRPRGIRDGGGETHPEPVRFECRTHLQMETRLQHRILLAHVHIH